jgi:hypothetical protein
MPRRDVVTRLIDSPHSGIGFFEFVDLQCEPWRKMIGTRNVVVHDDGDAVLCC